MKTRIVLVVVLFVVVLAPAAADVGAGVILGSPTGVSVLVDNRVALAAAWNINNRLHLHADVWLLNRTLADPIDWYLGVGGKVLLLSDDVYVGARLPLGLQWYVLPNLELFGEVVPGLQVVPSTGFDIDAGLGIRIHF
ncbi:MAG: hypothetical protein WCY01_13520 [Alkalispirochaeta sp.]